MDTDYTKVQNPMPTSEVVILGLCAASTSLTVIAFAFAYGFIPFASW